MVERRGYNTQMAAKSLPTYFRYLDIITALFVAVLLISNIVSTKITAIGWLTFDGGTLLFPLAYIFGDVLTEVYGYKKARRVIWIGLVCNLLLAGIVMLVGVLPAASDWTNQTAYDTILGLTPRIVLGSIIAYFAGEFSNSFVMAKMKVFSKGKNLWMRTIGSTLVGELLDTLLFITIAFYGALPMDLLISIAVSNYIFKVGVEVLFTPFTYIAVNFLKKAEHEDYYDTKTNFNPFVLSGKGQS
jgi:queuosine precursor transporter